MTKYSVPETGFKLFIRRSETESFYEKLAKICQENYDGDLYDHQAYYHTK